MPKDEQQAQEKRTSQLPVMDSETACLMRSFLVPAIEAARNWADLRSALEEKGLTIGFRDGRLVFKRLETGEELCTGHSLGTPLRELSVKLGRPSIRANADGHTGSLTP
jgi:hypothetical protein